MQIECIASSLFERFTEMQLIFCKDTKNIVMAEKKQGVSYESVMKDLKARNFSPVYLLMGDESYYCLLYTSDAADE